MWIQIKPVVLFLFSSSVPDLQRWNSDSLLKLVYLEQICLQKANETNVQIHRKLMMFCGQQHHGNISSSNFLLCDRVEKSQSTLSWKAHMLQLIMNQEHLIIDTPETNTTPFSNRTTFQTRKSCWCGVIVLPLCQLPLPF